MAKIGLARVLEALEQDGYQGFCLACGADAYGVEPDAENYECGRVREGSGVRRGASPLHHRLVETRG